MATLLANDRNKVASAPAAGLVVVNDHAWDIQVAASGDYIHIGHLPAYHKILAEASTFYAEGADLAAGTFTVFVGEPGEEAAGNTLVSAEAVVADTPEADALVKLGAARSLGSSGDNRNIYIKLGAAITEAVGKVTLRLASFTATP